MPDIRHPDCEFSRQGEGTHIQLDGRDTVSRHILQYDVRDYVRKTMCNEVWKKGDDLSFKNTFPFTKLEYYMTCNFYEM